MSKIRFRSVEGIMLVLSIIMFRLEFIDIEFLIDLWVVVDRLFRDKFSWFWVLFARISR